MKPLGLISQIAAIGLAVAIVTLFVQPTFNEIGDLQTEIQGYSVERERVNETNMSLAARVSDLEAIAVNDRSRVVTYLPTLLDEVAVLRDLEIIAQNAGVGYTSIEYNGLLVDRSDEARLAQVTNLLQRHEFTVTIDGNYNSLKDFFSLLEQNAYPLQISALEISPLDGGFLTADATIVTYITGPDLDVE